MKIKYLFLMCLALVCSCEKRGAGRAAGGASFVDDDGAEFSFAKPRSRIVSLYSAHTENLFAIGAGSAVIGGHKTCTYPPEAAPLAIYDYSGDPEYVIAAAPDLVLIRSFVRRRSPDYIAELEKAEIPVVSLYTEDFDGFDGYITRLAALCGVDAGAKLAEFHAALETIRAKTAAIPPEKRRRVFFESSENNVRTIAAGSFPALALEFAGAVNIAQDAPPVNKGSSIASFGAERLLEKAAEIDVYIAQKGAMNEGVSVESIKARPGFSAIKAVQEGRILVIDEKIISSPTFRFAEGVLAVARFAYPELQWN